jgi:hypothetical protein
MSQDGRPQVISRDITGVEDIPSFNCEHKGWVYARRRNGFAKCSKGYTHCLRCEGLARRFRKGFVCDNKECS